MIIDMLSAADQYLALHPTFQLAFHYLRTTDLASLPPGRIAIDGERIYAMVQEYQTKLESDAKWESHRRYIDIQYIVSGSEWIRYANISQMTLGEYKAERDFQAMSGEGNTVALSEGYFAIFFPQDAHMPGLMKGAPAGVKKVVLKCLV